MFFTFRSARLALTLLILVTFVFVACQRAGSVAETERSDVQIALRPLLPEETLVVILTDADGAPVTDAAVAVEGNMNHAGMIPVLAEAVADDADGSADGEYHLPFTFTMLGDWIITVTVTQADGSSFSRNLDVRASEGGVSGDTVMPMDDAMDGAAPASTDEDASDAHNHADHDPSDHSDHSDAGTHATAIHIHDAMARPAPLEGGNGAVYFQLHNGSDVAVRLLGADSPAASAVEIHTTENDEGVLRMRQLADGVEIGPDESIHLQPGGMHLMLIDLAAPLVEGETVEVTLHFDGADEQILTVPVVAMDELSVEAEAQHNH